MPTATTFDIVFTDVRRRTGQLAKTQKNEALAVMADDQEIIQSFFDSAVTRILTAVGILSTTREDFDGTDTTEPETTAELQAENDPSLVPVELYDALTFYVMWEWFRTNGFGDLGNYYEGEYLKQLSQYRFAPNTPPTASRKYRGV